MSAWSLEEGCEAVNFARNFDDLVDVFDVLFHITKAAVEKYDDLKASLDALPEAPTALELHDLLKKLDDSRNWIVNDALYAIPEYAQIIDRAKGVTNKEIKKAIGRIGLSFFQKNIPDIGNEVSEISRIQNKLDPLEKKAKELERELFVKINSESNKMAKEDPEYKAAWDVYMTTRIHEEGKEAFLKMSAVREKYYKIIYKKFIQDNEEYNALMGSLSEVQEESGQRKDAFFQKITDGLLASTDITEEQATDWVENNVVFNGAADRRLKGQQNPYSVEELKKDLAELYRYVGGKLGPIEFVARGANRAWAKGKGHIEIDNYFSKKTLFHECGHLIEAWDEAINATCTQFVADRAKSHPVSLRRLTGNKGYRSNEKAYPDTFIDPYVGKDYGGRASEVFSMGVQCLSSPEALAMLAEKDPEHFLLTMGICLRRNPALKKEVQKEVERRKKITNAEEMLKMWKKAIKKAITQDFIDAIKSENGIDGYRIDAPSKYDAYLSVRQEEQGKWIVRQLDKEKILLPIAYFYVANSKHLLPHYYENIDYVARRFSSVEVPEWFDPKKPLPRIIV